ncbi:MAG: tetratricopeptide repeat protein [Candidatus Deferrimicrobiaceae bacterium]
MRVNVRERKWTYRYLTFGLLTLLFSISMAVPAFGGQFEDATAAYERGDFATAFRLMKPLAEKGDAKAQHNLGVMYDYGRGVPQDSTKALKWYRMAAEHGIPEAQHNLGLMYQKAQGVPQNYAEAAKWYRRAAEQGMADSQVNLGMMYYHGQGVPRDYVLAHMWLDLAASQYPASVRENLNDAVHYKDIVNSLMTPAQIAEAKRLAREWKPKKEGK